MSLATWSVFLCLWFFYVLGAWICLWRLCILCLRNISKFDVWRLLTSFDVFWCLLIYHVLPLVSLAPVYAWICLWRLHITSFYILRLLRLWRHSLSFYVFGARIFYFQTSCWICLWRLHITSFYILRLLMSLATRSVFWWLLSFHVFLCLAFVIYQNFIYHVCDVAGAWTCLKISLAPAYSVFFYITSLDVFVCLFMSIIFLCLFMSFYVFCLFMSFNVLQS